MHDGFLNDKNLGANGW